MSSTDHLLRSRLSRRGSALVTAPPVPEYLLEHFAHSAATDAQGPYTALCIAENRLVWDLLEPRVNAARQVPHRAWCYDDMTGSAALRQALARFMGRSFLGRMVEPAQVAVLAGAGSVLELLFYALADPGDAVLVPTPSYAGFWADLETRDGLTIVPVNRSPDDGFHLSAARLDAAVRAAERPVKALLFTSPDNPLGRVFERAEIEEVLRWAEATGVHLVVDEIYALSVFGERPFASVASLGPRLGELVHVVWAFSKDFGASGLRCGVLVSENEALLAAVNGLAYWAACSGDTQHLLAGMVADDAWVDAYVATMRGRLGEAYRRVTAALAEEAIPFVPADAGFFLLLDLRSFLAEPSWPAEHALWRRLLDVANVNLTPGAACHNGEPGFLRLCFAAAPTADAVAAVHRIGDALRS